MKKIYLLGLLALLAAFALFGLKKPSEDLLVPAGLPSAQPLVSFAVIGDPESDIENLNKALEIIKQKELQFVIIVGDLTEVGTPEQFEAIKKALEKSKVEYYVIPGNHDLWYGRKQCMGQEEEEFCSNVLTYRQYFSQNYYAENIHDLQFVFLDNGDEWLGLGRAQLDWLRHFLLDKKEFKEGQLDQKYLVFSHIPLHHPESDYVVGYHKKELRQEARDLLTEFCDHPPFALFFGHLHHTNDYEYKCKNGNQLKMYIAGSVNDKRNWQLPRFLKVDLYEGGRLKIEEIELQ